MASGAFDAARGKRLADVLSSLRDNDGSLSHAFFTQAKSSNGRVLADTTHHLCALHGRFPGVVDLAAERRVEQREVIDWLEAASEGIARERAYLTRVVVAAGPIPSTPGQAECEAAVIGQRHAIEMLAKSDRTGCALGAAFALVLDWRELRSVIDRAAQRFSVDTPTIILPTIDETLAVADCAAISPGVERAIIFGAQQLLVQHRGLWDLLEARQIAREAA
jgi:hypothetical protein